MTFRCPILKTVSLSPCPLTVWLEYTNPMTLVHIPWLPVPTAVSRPWLCLHLHRPMYPWAPPTGFHHLLSRASLLQHILLANLVRPVPRPPQMLRVLACLLQLFRVRIVPVVVRLHLTVASPSLLELLGPTNNLAGDTMAFVLAAPQGFMMIGLQLGLKLGSSQAMSIMVLTPTIGPQCI
jgi:hypothetical protein